MKLTFSFEKSIDLSMVLMKINISVTRALRKSYVQWIIWRSEECFHLGCGFVWVLSQPTFSEESIASVFRVEKISELGAALAVISKYFKVERIKELGKLPVARKPLLFTANVVPSSLFLYRLKMEEIFSSETSLLTRHTAPHPRRWHSS
jgi:hypothetical protein